MPPVWTEQATAVAQVQDGDLAALGGHTRRRPKKGRTAVRPFDSLPEKG